MTPQGGGVAPRMIGRDGAKALGDTDPRTLILALQALRKTPVAEGYWDRFCNLMRLLCRANGSILIQRQAQNIWLTLGSDDTASSWLSGAWAASVAELAPRALQNGYAYSPTQDEAGKVHLVLVVRMTGLGEGLLVFDVPEKERSQLNDLIVRALLVTDFSGTDKNFSSTQVPALHQPGVASAGLLDMLDLAAQVMQKEHFGSAALALVNGVAAHFGLAHSALGWLQDSGEVHAVALSHLERFERKTHNVRLVEEAFDEAIGQETELWFPTSQSSHEVLVAHSRLVTELGYGRVCTLPIRHTAGRTRAILLLAFQQDEGTHADMSNLMLVLELLQPWLSDLHDRDRFWAKRLLGWLRVRLERLLGPDHLWPKTFGLLVSVLLLYVLLGSWDYRVEATCQLTTESTRLISAQFDGRVEEVYVSAGDEVKAGQPLASLDTKEYRQQEAEIRADLRRDEAEVAKYRAQGNLAEMEVTMALQAQSEAKLARVLEYLEQARSVAPFAGVVVEGERKELLGSPVKKGDRIFRIARTEGLYPSLSVPEREISYVRPNATGELYLISHPDQKIKFAVISIIPAAEVKGQEGNQFTLNAKLMQDPESWWRPGMSGVARIEAGRRNIAWILTHRVIDNMRMKFWW